MSPDDHSCRILKYAGTDLGDHTICQTPYRYGKTEYNSETAVNVFIDILEDQSGKEYTSEF